MTATTYVLVHHEMHASDSDTYTYVTEALTCHVLPGGWGWGGCKLQTSRTKFSSDSCHFLLGFLSCFHDNVDLSGSLRNHLQFVRE